MAQGEWQTTPGRLQQFFPFKSKKHQRPDTKAIGTQIQPSKPKQTITKIRNSQNTKRTYGQPSELLFPKSWPLSNQNRTKNINM